MYDRRGPLCLHFICNKISLVFKLCAQSLMVQKECTSKVPFFVRRFILRRYFFRACRGIGKSGHQPNYVSTSSVLGIQYLLVRTRFVVLFMRIVPRTISENSSLREADAQ